MASNGKLQILFAYSSGKKASAILDIMFGMLKDAKKFKIVKCPLKTSNGILSKQEMADIYSSKAVIALITNRTSWLALEPILRKMKNECTYNKESVYLFISQNAKVRSDINNYSNDIFYFDDTNYTNIKRQVNICIDNFLKVRADFFIAEAYKRSTIHTNGVGFVTYRHKLIVSRRPYSKVQSLYGQFKVTKDAISRAGKQFPPVEEMSKLPLLSPKKVSFRCRALSHGADDIALAAVDRGRKKPNNERKFDIILSRPLKPEETFEWAWGFSFPKLYKKKGEGSSAYLVNYPCETLNLEVHFELSHNVNENIEFKTPPNLIHTDSKGKLKRINAIPTTHIKDLCFLKYQWFNIKDVNKGDKLLISWELA